ncbi:MAG: sulfotransferase [Alphaproteobacteria bacterium]|nr:sulfotransferase [Alphaproteobacteria bacterium]
MVSRNAHSPVFIVGSPRSGTSILVDGLLSAGYEGYREGSFLSLITPLSTIIDRHYSVFATGNPKLLISQVPKDRLKGELFEALKRIVEEHNKSAPWLDKTGNPEMVQAIPALRALWTDSVFIFAKRRGIENVVSRLKKFPQHNFRYHCDDWARNMRSWRDIRDTLPGHARLEIDQQEIAQFPENTADRIATFLNINDSAARIIADTFREKRPQQTSDGTASRLLDLTGTRWSQDQIEVFQQSCSAEMDAYGYSLDSTYWRLQQRAPSETAVGS